MDKKSLSDIVTITLNPALDQTLYVAEFQAGQLNRVNLERIDAGGKGINVAKVISALGYGITVSGFLGQENAHVFRDFFATKQISNCFVEVEGATRVNIKIMDESSGEVSELNFTGLKCSVQELERLEATIKKLAAEHEIFILSGSLPQGAPDDIYRRFIEMLKQYGCKVFLDASGEALTEGIKAKPYAIKPNLPELRQLVGRPLQDEAAVAEAVEELLNMGISLVVVSMGAQGALVADGKEHFMVRPPQVRVGSTVGAGDAMVAGLAVGEAQGLTLIERARLGTAAAAASVAKPGTQAASLLDIQNMLKDIQIEKMEAKA